MSYLGGSFCGWQKGNSHSKPSVQDTLARAIAATGLCERSATKSKRAAARAERRQQAQQRAKQLAAAAAAIDDDNVYSSGGGLSDPDGLAAASTTHSNALAAAGGQSSVCPPAMDPLQQQDAAAGSGGSSAAVQPQQQPQLPSLQSGGRTDAGVTAVGQVGWWLTELGLLMCEGHYLQACCRPTQPCCLFVAICWSTVAHLSAPLLACCC